jgi:hypothetical protein
MRAADNKFRYTDAAPKEVCKIIADEVVNFHPLVAQHLGALGYYVELGVDLRSGKTIDLVASRSNEVLLVECKNK